MGMLSFKNKLQTSSGGFGRDCISYDLRTLDRTCPSKAKHHLKINFKLQVDL
jgi:hypothetical protein